jgi:hypothetical protein
MTTLPHANHSGVHINSRDQRVIFHHAIDWASDGRAGAVTPTFSIRQRLLPAFRVAAQR